MKLTMLLALDKNNLIGDSATVNGLPWHHPEDLAFYKKMTTGKKNLMGRKTFDQIGRPLPNRETIVMTKQNDWGYPGVTVIHNKHDLRNLDISEDEEVILVGGVQLFELFFDEVDEILLTRINNTYTGDLHYDINLEDFKLVDEHTDNSGELTFQKWLRK